MEIDGTSSGVCLWLGELHHLRKLELQEGLRLADGSVWTWALGWKGLARARPAPGLACAPACLAFESGLGGRASCALSHRRVLMKQGSVVIWFTFLKNVFSLLGIIWGRLFLSSRPEMVAPGPERRRGRFMMHCRGGGGRMCPRAGCGDGGVGGGIHGGSGFCLK